MSRNSRLANGRGTAARAAPEPDFSSPDLYINREISLLDFQRRVLEEAEDPTNPLLERMKFLSIVGSNLDEFFMIRVAGLTAQAEAGTAEAGFDGLSPRAQLTAIRREVKKLMADTHRCLEKLKKELEDHGIYIHEYSELTAAQLETAAEYFTKTVFPVLTPLAFDPGRPFPHISNLSLNLAVSIRDGQGNEHFARVKVPDSLPQLVPLNRTGRNKGKKRARRVDLVWLEQVVAAHLDTLFPGMDVIESHPFHVTRDADFSIKELEAEDLLETVEEGVRQRRFGSVIRLGVTEEMPSHILDLLMSNLEVASNEVYKVNGPLSLKRLMDAYQLDRPDLRHPAFVPAVPAALVEGEDEEVFAVIRRRNILLHHPFDSFQPVIDFLSKSAHDPKVLAIKICLYRVGRNSPVVDALLEAVEEDKQVASLVELKARFDEESNIEWARALERAGVHVVYGLVGLKIHSKVALIVRREGGQMMRYVHLSTGNYNAVTAHIYTDLGMFTADPDIADDATDLFNYLTGYSAKADYKKLLVAPLNLREQLEKLIEREIAHARAGRKAHLIFKTNALSDLRIIRLLYKASMAGVKIQLIVRGICCLRPGMEKISENIEVVSIVGRFLEHTRIYWFQNGGEEQIYIGSADLMSRNIDRRVEVLFPMEDDKLIRRIREELLATYLADNVKARRLQANGSYTRKKVGDSDKQINSQERLLRIARRGSGELKPLRLKPRG